MSKKTKKTKNFNGITIHFIPYSEIAKLDSTSRIKKFLEVVLKEKVIVLQGRLKPEEETRLIEDTMVLIGTIKGFKGIELEVITPTDSDISIFSKFKQKIASALVGQTNSLTIVGPAAVIKEMRKDPKSLEIMMN